jgi:hypothetical protein
VELEDANDHFYNEPSGTVFGFRGVEMTTTGETSVNYGAVSGDVFGVEDTAGDNIISNYGTIEGPTAGLNITAGGDTITNSTTGTISGGIHIVSGGQTIINTGAIDGGITFAGTGNSNSNSVTNSGEITGSITLSGGQTTIDNDGTINGAGGTAISLGSGPDTVVLGETSVLDGAITGFAIGDFIDLQGLQFNGTKYSGGVLTLLENGSQVGQLGVLTPNSSPVFLLSADGSGGTKIEAGNPAPPAGTSADMIMTDGSGNYEIYDIGGNAILTAYTLDQLPTFLTFAALGTFQAGDSSDMLLRNASTGAFVAYYVTADTVTSSAPVGTVGTNFSFAGIGDFDGMSGLSELLLRNSASGAFELYQVAGGGVLSGNAAGAVGNNFSVKGFGQFSESNTTQMMMQDTSGDASKGQVELYTYQPGSASFTGIDVGKVGSNLSIVGMADLLGNGSTQMVMQQNNGDFWLYTYSAATNSLSGILVGAIGSNFHVVGFGPLGTAGQDEMLMQDAAGDFEVYQYNASLNAFVGTSMGAVGAPWVVDGIAADPPGGSSAAVGASTAQLVQAMASMGGGAAVGTAANPTIGADPSQPTLLSTPHA